MAKAKTQAGAFQLWVNTDGWTVDQVDSFVIDLLEVATSYGTTAHVEIPMMAWAVPAIEWASSEGNRCLAVKTKAFHETQSNAQRSMKGSSWRCGLVAGHEGMHRAPEHAHQSPWS